MSTKSAFLRLLVAVMGLLASILELATAAIRLGSALLERASLAIRPKAQTVVPAVAKTVMTEPIGPSQEERIHAALVGMGFTAGCVRKFMASVRGRQAPLETLVKEGIVALSATN